MTDPNREKCEKVIVVAGDASVDWFEISTPSLEAQSIQSHCRYNWQSYPGFRRFARPGGALLLAEFVRKASCARIIAPDLEDLHNTAPNLIFQAYAALDAYPRTSRDKGETVYRLKEWKGYAPGEAVKPLKLEDDPSGADLIIFDDAGNGFRDENAAWDNIISGTLAPVILKMSRPLGEGALWKALKSRDNQMVLIVEADDLRMMDVKISRSISWERTAQDLAWQMAYNRYIEFLHDADCLVVRFGADGAILYDNYRGGSNPRLFFDPVTGEEGFDSVCPGEMAGIGAAFTAALAAGLMGDGGLENIGEAVNRGIRCAKRLWLNGFGSDANRLDYQYEPVFQEDDNKDFFIADARIPAPTPEADQVYWCILEELPTFVETIATNFVVTGQDESLDRVPIGRFGNLSTMDRSEIESFNSIKNLVNEYLNSPSVKRPLSIGVFGPPGSGKSFGVTEVVKSIAPERIPGKPLEFNLSQYNSLEDLITSFHKVRDVALEGIVPLVFFDEFDSEFRGDKLGWLKYFLAPMQDGLFRDGEALHPLGRAIFVFAGGTKSTFEEFSRQETSQAFRDAKGSDFVSRLRGYINIKGPNPIGGDLRQDRLSMIRRATVLRFLLNKHAPQIFKPGKICLIDRGVLQAFIKVPFYKHGIRSMQSIIEMSALAGRNSYEQAALPPPDQLELHVDADAFQRIVVREVIFRAAREKIAMAIHEHYREKVRADRPPDEPSMQPWDRLSAELKASNLGQADHIPEKLRALNCDFIPVTGREVEVITFNPEEIELMAEMEHVRFVEEKESQGWVHGEKRDNRNKVRTDLIPWEELDEELRELDRNAVRVIPELMARAGLEIYRLG